MSRDTQHEPTPHPSITVDDVIDAARASMYDGEYSGACLRCSSWHDGIEPDADGYTGEHFGCCHDPYIVGSENLLMMVA